MTGTKYRKAIDSITPYSPGKPIEEVARELGLDPSSIIKLASNENPLGPSPLAVTAMHSHLNDVRLYPDSDSYELRQAIAKYLNVEGNQVIVGRGSDEIMHFIAVAYLEEGDEVIMGNPPFSMYEISTLTMGATPVKIPLKNYAHDLQAMADAVTDKTKIIYIANPHNPTGAINTKAELEAFLPRIPDHVLIVLDDAYFQYATDQEYPDSLSYLDSGKNIIVMHTFSKIYSLAGLRVGYAVSKRKEVIFALNQVREPFNVANIAQWAAIASLNCPDQINKGREVNEAGKQLMYAAFDEMGMEYVPSNANFILVDVGKPCRAVFNGLLKLGVIVRTGDIFGYPNKIRVTIGTAEENLRFINSLKQVISEL
jgi:histidinol-phosphate aminotransferase